MTGFTPLLANIQRDALEIHSLLIQRGTDRLLTAYGYPYGPDDPHDVRSVTKSVTALLVGIAINQGRLPGVDARLVDLLPAAAAVEHDLSGITLDHLLTMTSGLAWEDADTWDMLNSPDWTAFVLDKAPDAAPGARFRYATPAYQLVAAILHHAVGDVLVFAREHFFAPLGIADVYWLVGPQGVPAAGMGLFLRPENMLKIGLLVRDGGRAAGRQIVPQAWVEAATTTRIIQPDGNAYGYGFWVRPNGNAFAVGYGGQTIYVVPAEDLVVALTAANNSLSPIELVEESILPLLDQATPSAAVALFGEPPAGPVLTLPPTAAEVSGATYAMDENPFKWERVTLTFEDGAAQAHVAINNHAPLPVGLDGHYRITPGGHFIHWLPRTFPTALRGSWLDEQTFFIAYREIGLPEPQDVTLRFAGDTVSVTIDESLSNDTQTFSGRRL